MKKLLLILAIFLTINCITAQSKKKERSINDFNFESVTTPAFLLIDETPTFIETPDNLKSLSLYLYNGFSEGNIAVEVNPYWAFKTFGYNNDDSYEKYRGLKRKPDGSYCIDPWRGLSVNTSFSLGYTEKKFEGFDSKNKALAIGGRTTVLELYNKKRSKKISDIVTKVDDEYTNEALNAYDDYLGGVLPRIPTPDVKKCEAFVKDNDDIPDKYKKAAKDFLTKYPQYKVVYAGSDVLLNAYFEETSKKVLEFYYMSKNIKPNFRLDGAVGYSLLFLENDFDKSTHRFGSWLIADFAFDISKKKQIKPKDKNANNYIHILAIAKYVDDGFIIDGNQNFSNTNFWDYGGKIELEINKLKFSYEYLERDGEGEQYRSVGNITYQYSKKISITGGFGKDFPEDNNLVTLLGINWGLDLGDKSLPNK